MFGTTYMSLSVSWPMLDAANRPEPASAVLPNGFEALSDFVEKWGVADEIERMRAREKSPTSELRHFYERMQPFMEGAMLYLRDYELGKMPPEAASLYRLALSFMDVGFLLERVARTDRDVVYPLSRIQFEIVGAF